MLISPPAWSSRRGAWAPRRRRQHASALDRRWCGADGSEQPRRARVRAPVRRRRGVAAGSVSRPDARAFGSL